MEREGGLPLELDYQLYSPPTAPGQIPCPLAVDGLPVSAGACQCALPRLCSSPRPARPGCVSQPGCTVLPSAVTYLSQFELGPGSLGVEWEGTSTAGWAVERPHEAAGRRQTCTAGTHEVAGDRQGKAEGPHMMYEKDLASHRYEIRGVYFNKLLRKLQMFFLVFLFVCLFCFVPALQAGVQWQDLGSLQPPSTQVQAILLPQPWSSWDYRCTPPRPANFRIFCRNGVSPCQPGWSPSPDLMIRPPQPSEKDSECPVLRVVKFYHLIIFSSQICFTFPFNLTLRSSYKQNGQAQWLTAVIPALWKADVGGSQGQEIEAILANMVKPHLYKNKKISWAWWHVPVVPSTQEADVGNPQSGHQGRRAKQIPSIIGT
ncbi:hypothetical protein AAY473_011205 [Plecturocebus cupreus]